ncbi:UPF0187-domain-containing protein [Anaeromyces robustus]|uniref:UPF0187-domain-containing protein n=1 Tax=Anaeromyces robustus TaxID=1754192 RepID=A0A1Y1X3Z3_9FUNG|nr:UPF0187-domain-containing protein [Anaeromyces robustus]|eukprot:ORX80358.1 UPF0187-domain-containing protein [Anaeromyces robustus]
MKINRILLLKKMKNEIRNENRIFIPRQTGNVRWRHILMLSRSVIPKIYIPVLIFVIYTTLLKLFYDNFKEHPHIDNLFFPSSLVTYLGLVLSLLLVFRNNSAYDRYWEGRKAWANILHHARNLSRHIWIGVDIDENDKLKDEKLNLKKGAMRLIIALVISIRHNLRGEYGWDYKDLAELVQHVPRFNSLITVASNDVLRILPLEIAYHIEGYIFQQKGLIVPIINNTFASINSIIENYTSCERILTTPIPLIYGVHIKHAMIIYLLTLPLQIIKTCGWASVVIVLLTSFTFFGIEAISSEIENPFGGDENDLKLEIFCKQINDEINNMMNYFPSSTALLDWLECEDIENNITTTEDSDNNSSSSNTLINGDQDTSSRSRSISSRSSSIPNIIRHSSSKITGSFPFLRKKRHPNYNHNNNNNNNNYKYDDEQRLNEGESSNQTNYGTCSNDHIEIICNK